jgi:hypothetical protein
MPPPFVQGGPLPRAAEGLEAEGAEVQRESGARLTGARRTELHARQMGQVTAGGVAKRLPQQEYQRGRDRRGHAIASRGLFDVAARREHGFGVQQRGPPA